MENTIQSELIKGEIMKIVFGLGEYYDKNLNKNQIAMYAEDLSVLTADELFFAIREYRKDPANVFFPLPAKLIAIVKPIESEKDIGQMVAARIITAISKFGYNNQTEAKIFVGEIGWEVIRYQGGWLSLCQLSSEELKNEQPRLRELAITINKKSKIGNLHEAPKLSKNNSEVLNLISNTTKQLGEIK